MGSYGKLIFSMLELQNLVLNPVCIRYQSYRAPLFQNQSCGHYIYILYRERERERDCQFISPFSRTKAKENLCLKSRRPHGSDASRSFSSSCTAANHLSMLSDPNQSNLSLCNFIIHQCKSSNCSRTARCSKSFNRSLD